MSTLCACFVGSVLNFMVLNRGITSITALVHVCTCLPLKGQYFARTRGEIKGGDSLIKHGGNFKSDP